MRNRKITISFLGIVMSFLLLLGMGGQHTLWAAPSDIVNIPDTNLKTLVNTSLGQAAGSDITQGQMASIITLNLNNSAISDLTGLEYATGLLDLRMSTNQVTNLEVLRSLTSLNYLALQGSNVTSDNFPDLAHLTSLIQLDLSSSGVDNSIMEKINKISSLETVRFQSNSSITNIEPLTALPNLTALWVQFCGINDFRPINNMPLLTSLLGAGQNTGRLDPPTELDRTKLAYDASTETLHLPFSMMPNVLTNFDGALSPFTTSTSPTRTNLSFNGQLVPEVRLVIDGNGITVNGVTLSEFQGLDEIEYNAYYDLPAGSYATPPGFNFYAISGGTYLHVFNIIDKPIITANSPVYYWQNNPVSESRFLADISATTNDRSAITSDFAAQVNFSVPGTYTVTLRAQSSSGVNAEAVQVTVIVKERPTISAKDEITYYQFSNITEESFYKDISVSTDPSNQLRSDFLSKVDFDVVGTYQVTIVAVNEEGIESAPISVLVHIIPKGDEVSSSTTTNQGTESTPSGTSANVAPEGSPRLTKTGELRGAETWGMVLALLGVSLVGILRGKIGLLEK